MKSFIVILFLIVPIICICQNNSDTLKKYTYYIASQQPVNDTQITILQATGFFVRDNGKLFFITAQHVLNGCRNNPNDTCIPAKKPKYYPDFANIYLTKDGTPTNKSIFIDIRIIKDTTDCTTVGNQPDVIAYEVQNNTGDTIYSIEKFLYKEPPKRKGDLSVYGFPSKTIPQLYGYVALSPVSNFRLVNYKLINYYSLIGCNNKKVTDSVDYVINPKDSLDYDLYGYSGSPAFILDKKKKEWIFIGFFTATADKLLIFCKPLFIYYAIRNRR